LSVLSDLDRLFGAPGCAILRPAALAAEIGACLTLRLRLARTEASDPAGGFTSRVAVAPVFYGT